MTVYLDILLFLNSVIDFFLLNLATFIIGRKIKTKRIIIAALFSSTFSFLIFVPKLSYAIEMLLTLIFVLIVAVVTVGFKNKIIFLKFYFALLSVSMAFNGLIILFWNIFKPNGMLIRNSVLYLNISAIEMIGWTVASYVIIRLVLFIIRRSSPTAARCKVTLENLGKTIELTALVDTGNSLKDVYTGKQVIIVDYNTANELFGDTSDLLPVLLPYSTVDNQKLLSAYYCKKTKVNNREIGVSLIAVAEKTIENTDYKAIVSPQILSEVE